MKFACQPLCEKALGRIHVQCTTCLVRRYYYGKLDPDDYLWLDKNEKIALANWMIPQPVFDGEPRYSYFLIVNVNGNWLKRLVKSAILQVVKAVNKLMYRSCAATLKRGNFMMQVFQSTVFPLRAAWVPFIIQPSLGGHLLTTGELLKTHLFQKVCSFAEVIANW